MPRRVLHPIAFGAYLLVALAAFWPLPLNLGSHLPGPPSGDTGVYVWNLWVFRHELVEHGRLPLATSKVFSLGAPADLSLHNYTSFADALAFPLLPHLGVVATFNGLMLLFTTLNGWCTFLLARHVTGRTLEAWLAGAMFAVSPVLIARSTAHFSLVSAFVLPLAVLAVLRGLESGAMRHAWGAGASVALAAFCDPYYAVYATLLVGLMLVARLAQVHWHRHHARATWLRVLEVAIAMLGGLVVGLTLRGGRTVTVLGLRIAVQTLYTPVLLLTVLVIVRIAMVWRPTLALPPLRAWRPAARFAAVAVLAAALFLSPTLVALGMRVAEGRFDRPAIHWRSSPPGVDLLAFVMPNPNHPLYGQAFHDWLTRGRPDGFAEFTAAIPWVPLLVIGLALIRWRSRVPRRWVAVLLLFGALSLGPFVQVAGVNTFVPGPWALLRYAPVVELARSPARFAVVVTLAVSVLFACALAALRDHTGRRRLVTAGLVALLAFELWPAPRPLASARVPAIYDIVRNDPDHSLRLLELPTGIRDGTSSLGNFSAETQYFQTYHEKRLMGGYLSRVSRKRKLALMSFPVFSALTTLSAGGRLTEQEEWLAWRHRGRFLRRTNLGYVVVDTRRSSPELRQFAVDLFELELIAESEGRVLYRPRTLDLAGRTPPK